MSKRSTKKANKRVNEVNEVKKMKKITCSICGDKIEVEPTGWIYGHNAAPITNGRCCSVCNSNVVIPVRMSYHEIEKMSKRSGTPVQTIIDNIAKSRLACI